MTVQTIIVIDDLPGGALDAAAQFHARWVQAAKDAAASGSVVVVLPAAAHDHRDWRIAAVRDLARAAAPRRVNFVSAPHGQSADQTLSYLAGAPGVTGQYFELAEAE